MILFTGSFNTGLDRLIIQDAQINNDASYYFISYFIICELIEILIW